MQSTIIDTGPLVALFDRDDRHHAAAVQFVKAVTGRLVTNVAVITEVTHLLDFSPPAVADFLSWVQSFDLDGGTSDDIPRIIEIMAKYKDLPADFADASLVALSERRGISHVATLDSDFEVYRINGRKKFINVFGR